MKLNGVIIINRRHMKDFFSFSEFWRKRKEFRETVNRDVFFKSADKNQKDLKVQVTNWISGIPLSADKQLNSTSIILPNRRITRLFTTQCEDELARLPKEDAFGIVALYEMMGRNLRQDIFEILFCLGYETLDPTSGIIVIQNNSEHHLKQYDPNEAETGSYELKNVLIANLSEENGISTIILGDRVIKINSGKCIRAVFYGDKCLRLLPPPGCPMQFELNVENYTTGLSLNGAIESVKGDVMAFAYGKKGYVYATASKACKFVAKHRNITDFFYDNPIGDDENIIYVELNANETKCLMLTDKKKLYVCDRDDVLTIVDTDVLMASFVNNELQTIKIKKV